MISNNHLASTSLVPLQLLAAFIINYSVFVRSHPSSESVEVERGARVQS